ncbi:MAG TPA: heavy metal-associated domain-containing protein [Fodinibius sp.]|nr:heavy metal-associated domain-containing protein [Fodinibius sp.]
MRVNNIISEDLKILVFRTNIKTSQSATTVRKVLLPLDGVYSVNIDLEDSENVLRVECHPDASPKIIKKLLAKLGWNSTELSYEIFDNSDSRTAPNVD